MSYKPSCPRVRERHVTTPKSPCRRAVPWGPAALLQAGSCWAHSPHPSSLHSSSPDPASVPSQSERKEQGQAPTMISRRLDPGDAGRGLRFAIISEGLRSNGTCSVPRVSKHFLYKIA